MFDAPPKSYLTPVNNIRRPEQRDGLGCLTWSASELKSVISVVLASSCPSVCLSACISAAHTDGFP